MKKLFLISAALCAALSLSSCAFVTLGTSTLSKDRAVTIAFEHFGVDSEKCKYVVADEDGDSFDVEFVCEKRKYEVEIDKATGKVTEADVEHIND